MEIRTEDVIEALDRFHDHLEVRQPEDDGAEALILHAYELGISQATLERFAGVIGVWTGDEDNAGPATVGLLAGVFAHRAAVQRSDA